jgi:hypothetical protein
MVLMYLAHAPVVEFQHFLKTGEFAVVGKPYGPDKPFGAELRRLAKHPFTFSPFSAKVPLRFLL